MVLYSKPSNLALLVRVLDTKSFLPPIVAEISWSKIYVITEKCEDTLQREFYIKMTKRYTEAAESPPL
jgi:hypothetical protein